MKALFAMMRKEFVHIRRDPQLVGFVLALPVLLLILFGYALRLQVDPMRVAVWDNDQAFFSAMIKDQLRDQGHFIVEEVASEEVVRDRLKHGTAHMGLVIPKGFTENVANYKQTEFPLFVDGSMPTLAQAALYGSRVLTSEEAAAKMVFEDAENPPPPTRKSPIKVSSVVLFNPELKDSDFFSPGTIGIVVMIVVLTLSSQLVREKEQATIEQLLVTPIGRFSLIAGKMIPYGIIAAFDFAVVSVLARFVFDLPLSGAVLPVTLLAAVFILALLALGALISTLSQTQLQANFMAVFVIVPSVLMSGFVFPIEAIPHWLQPVAYSLPMTYFVDAIRGLTLKGASMSDLMIDYLVLITFMVGFFLLSLAGFPEAARMTTAATQNTSTVLPDERHIRSGEFIFRQGEVGNEMFVIGEGSVRLVISTEDGHESDIGVFGKGEFFGELSLMSAAPRSASAIAAEDSVLLVVTRDVFSMMVQDDLEIVARMMSEQGRRLSRANEPITQLTQQLGRVRVAAHCLRRLLDGPPLALDAASLAQELGLPPVAVTSTIGLLAQEGIGALENGSWKPASADVARLSDAILRESDVE